MAALTRARTLSRGRAPRPRAATSAEAPASPTFMRTRSSRVRAGSTPAPSPSTSRCTPSGPAAPEHPSSLSISSAGSTEPSVPSNARSGAVRPLSFRRISFASRSSLQLRSPTFSCCSSVSVAVRSSLLALLKYTARRGSSTLHSWVKRMRCSSPLSAASAIAARAAVIRARTNQPTPTGRECGECGTDQPTPGGARSFLTCNKGSARGAMPTRISLRKKTAPRKSFRSCYP
eukprot:scaffold81118_cov62-Phaeocystis_antarctica.AAC.1